VLGALSSSLPSSKKLKVAVLNKKKQRQYVDKFKPRSVIRFVIQRS
jgi:hypothetical protein